MTAECDKWVLSPTTSISPLIQKAFIWIGNFKALSLPGMTFFFGSTEHTNYEGLHILGEWAVRCILKLVNANLDASDALGEDLVIQAARRIDKMVVAW
ncbi:hypothetical protein EDC04DRAFT_2912656 [Pisolithus marmoratus]|nr:hypothetical protein EDC04DRAFT_2912656 [Pisolithus marmoratus]